jgi:hypothetical protein
MAYAPDRPAVTNYGYTEAPDVEVEAALVLGASY